MSVVFWTAFTKVVDFVPAISVDWGVGLWWRRAMIAVLLVLEVQMKLYK